MRTTHDDDKWQPPRRRPHQAQTRDYRPQVSTRPNDALSHLISTHSLLAKQAPPTRAFPPPGEHRKLKGGAFISRLLSLPAVVLDDTCRADNSRNGHTTGSAVIPSRDCSSSITACPRIRRTHSPRFFFAHHPTDPCHPPPSTHGEPVGDQRRARQARHVIESHF
jgi:hypothetical protein